MSNSSRCMVMASATSMPAVFSVLAHCVHMCSPSKSQSRVCHEGLPGVGCIVAGSNNHCHWQLDVQKAPTRRDHAAPGCAQWPIVSMRWVSVHVAPYVVLVLFFVFSTHCAVLETMWSAECLYAVNPRHCPATSTHSVASNARGTSVAMWR